MRERAKDFGICRACHLANLCQQDMCPRIIEVLDGIKVASWAGTSIKKGKTVHDKTNKG